MAPTSSDTRRAGGTACPGRLHPGADPAGLGRRDDLEHRGVGRAEGQGELVGDDAGRADTRLHLDRAGSREPELALRGALRDDHAAEETWLAADAVEQTDDDVELVAEVDRGLVVDPGNVELLGGVGSEHRDAVGPQRVAVVEEPARLELRPHRLGTARSRRP
jgi:hypothetical protein